jgi:hypothetical protein
MEGYPLRIGFVLSLRGLSVEERKERAINHHQFVALTLRTNLSGAGLMNEPLNGRWELGTGVLVNLGNLLD